MLFTTRKKREPLRGFGGGNNNIKTNDEALLWRFIMLSGIHGIAVRRQDGATSYIHCQLLLVVTIRDWDEEQTARRLITTKI